MAFPELGFPKPKIDASAVRELISRVKGKPWSEVKAAEDRLWQTQSDCPALGLAPRGAAQKTQSRPANCPIKERLGQPLVDTRHP